MFLFVLYALVRSLDNAVSKLVVAVGVVSQ